MNYYKVTFRLSPLLPAREVLYADLDVLGFESISDTSDGVEAFIPEGNFFESSLEDLMVNNIPDQKVSFEVDLVEPQNWNAVWESQFDPIHVNENCVIRAPFHQPSGVEYDIIISPKMSFGTGHHETTFLMSQRLFELDLMGKSVMDMGCGTGVLAIIAKKLGAGHTEGVDIEEWAYQNSIENAEMNEVPSIVFFFGDVQYIENKSFDVVIANINRNVLLQDMPQYATALNEDGVLLLSGFYNSDIDVLVKKAEECGLKFVNSNCKNNWAIVQLSK